MITFDSLQRKLQGQQITLARPQSVGNQQNSIVHYSSFNPDVHWGQRQSFFCSSLKEMRATTIKSCDWPGCSFRTDIGASIHYPTIKSTTAEQRRRRSPVSTLIHRMIMTIMMMVWWCNGDGDEDDDLSEVQNRKRTTELCINSDPAAFFVPRLPSPCLAPRFARGFTIPTKCICSGLFRIQRGFTISKVHQHLFKILWPCLSKP